MKKTYGIDIKWLAVTSFEFRCGNTTVVSDPYITECVGTDCTWENIDNCDIILLGHAHWDHVTDIPRLVKKYHPLILCGDQTALPLAQWLNYTATRIYPMYPNLELDFGDVKIKALFGRHCSPGKTAGQLESYFAQNSLCAADPQMRQMQLLGSLEYRNYLFTTRDGVKVLLWGNEVIDSQKRMIQALKPDICILQLSKQTPEQIADLAAASGCKVLIPHHMDLSKTRAEYLPRVQQLQETFCKLVPDGICICPENGTWIEL